MSLVSHAKMLVEPMKAEDETGGWQGSAEAWAAFVERGDANRNLFLDPVMLDLLGDVQSKRVLDVGSGEGRFCRMLAERGALVHGVDPTIELLNLAVARQPGCFARARAETLPIQTASVDIVVSYITLVDIPGYREAIDEMARVVRWGGFVLVANVSSYMTGGPIGWKKDESGERLYVRLNNYAGERGEWVDWAGISIINWHRPLSSYMEAFLAAGLRLTRFLEPIPSDEAIAARPELEDNRLVPNFTVMKWVKE